MAPSIIIRPITENTVVVVLSSGIAIQISDTFPFGGEIQISESEEKLRLAKGHRILAVLPGDLNDTEEFRIEMEQRKR
jgi:hypothetical protein